MDGREASSYIYDYRVLQGALVKGQRDSNRSHSSLLAGP